MAFAAAGPAVVCPCDAGHLLVDKIHARFQYGILRMLPDERLLMCRERLRGSYRKVPFQMPQDGDALRCGIVRRSPCLHGVPYHGT